MNDPKHPGMTLNEAEGIARGVARMGVAEHDESPQARQSRVVLALMAEVDRVRKGGTPEVLDARHFSRQARWSRDTFGDGARTAAILDHIRKELLEIEADPTDLSEWVDVLILAADGAWRAGHTPQALVAAVIAKQATNEARVWPDWRTAEPGKAIEHDRTASGDTVQAPDVAARLRFAAAGRREYATNAPADQAAALEAAAETFDQAARIASGDVNSLRFAVPSWRWDEADALLGTDTTPGGAA